MEKGNGVEGTRPSMSMETVGVDEELEGNTSILRFVETFLRLFPIGLCVTALVIMLKNSQENAYGSVDYTDLGAFRYLVHANGICAGYSLFSAVIVALPRPSTMPRAWTFFLLDQVLTYIILAAGAASTEVLYLAEKGAPSAAWSSACVSFGPFCHKVTASIVITFVAVICYVMLSRISSYKLFNKYERAEIKGSIGSIFISNYSIRLQWFNETILASWSFLYGKSGETKGAGLPFAVCKPHCNYRRGH